MRPAQGVRKNHGALKHPLVKFGPWYVMGWGDVRSDEIGERGRIS